MEQKVVQKKKAEVNGTAKYDSDGKMLLPYKENGETTLKTQEQMKSILDKKDKKQKLGKKAIPSNKQKPIVREKKVADASFRSNFANKAVEQIQGLERKDMGDKVLLKYGKSTLARLMLRTYGFCAYRKGLNGGRLTLRVKSEEDKKELLDWLSKRVEQLKK